MIFENSNLYSIYNKSNLDIKFFLNICFEIYGIKYNIDINKNNILHLLCEYGDILLLKLFLNYISCLLDLKLFINIKNKQHKTPFNLALRNNHFDILKILLKYGADIDSRMQFGETSLHRSVSYNDTFQTYFLLNYGADANSLDYNNNSPLHFGCHNNCYNTVNILLKYGAKVNIKNNIGYYPIHNCLNEYCTCITQNRYVNKNTNKNKLKCKIKIIKKLLFYNADVNCIDNIGRTPIYFCIFSQICNLLISNGANINKINSTGDTPLHYACLNGNLEIVKILLKNNVNYKKINNNLESAIDICNNELILEEFVKYEQIQIEKQKASYSVYKCNVNEICKFKNLCDDIESIILNYVISNF